MLCRDGRGFFARERRSRRSFGRDLGSGPARKELDFRAESQGKSYLHGNVVSLYSMRLSRVICSIKVGVNDLTHRPNWFAAPRAGSGSSAESTFPPYLSDRFMTGLVATRLLPGGRLPHGVSILALNAVLQSSFTRSRNSVRGRALSQRSAETGGGKSLQRLHRKARHYDDWGSLCLQGSLLRLRRAGTTAAAWQAMEWIGARVNPAPRKWLNRLSASGDDGRRVSGC